MRKQDFISLYSKDSFVQTIEKSINSEKQTNTQLKGLAGSLDAVITAAIYRINPKPFLIVLHDKEEAAYFHSDIQNLFGDKETLFFPTSYKRPYQFDETENANILQRAEVLNRINQKKSSGEIIITYPEALTEKVINKRSLVENTFGVKVGEKLDTEFMAEVLSEYDFERTDFVYEAGQYAIRGGIVDLFSFANDLPYRVELFGNEVESIRTFDPTTQLSVENKKAVSIIPNIQTKLLDEKRESLLEYISKSTVIWFKDMKLTFDVIDKSFEKATESFDDVIDGAQVVSSPEQLFETRQNFKELLTEYRIVEFGNQFHFNAAKSFSFNAKSQPSFNKNFELLAENLLDNQTLGYSNILVSEVSRQLERFESIFEEISNDIQFQPLNIGIRQGFVDDTQKLVCYTDHQIFERFYKYQTKKKFSKSKALTLKELQNLVPGDYVTHIDHGVGKFVGLHKIEIKGKEQEVIRLVYKDSDMLNASIHSLHKISKYSGKEGAAPTLSKIGSPEWENKKKAVKRKVKDIAKDLIKLYAKRKTASGYAFSKDTFMQAELESSFIYEDTPDQAKATEDVKMDMEKTTPMDRLVCGDVGFGKTEVAIRAAFKAVCDSKQVAILVPTTVLAMQHGRSFKERLKDFPCKVEFINRFKTAKQTTEILKKVESGEIDILIGTHRIVSKDIKFKNLGLMIIDEEQKFGVKVKDKLKEMRVNVDSLTLTATPIPRTLQFSLLGARDLSIIATAPLNRQPITTEVHQFNDEILRDAISFEIKRGGQVFVVHNKIKDIDSIANLIMNLVPDARIGVAHGQMAGDRLEKIMMKFIENEYDILVSTTIIESGLDIPNANTIIINQAQNFGLSDLHQMRGRVGRSNRKAFCYLLAPPSVALSSDARKRLATLEEHSDLGDGFKVAMRDLDIRGAGDLLGGEQSGFINDIGFDTYHKILDEAVQELKESDFKDLFTSDEDKLRQVVKEIRVDCNIETDYQILIPEDYVSNISERLKLYSQLDKVADQEKLDELTTSISDRFGPMPEEVLDLIKTVKLRWIAEKLGVQRLLLKEGIMKCYLPESDNERYYKSDVFGRVLGHLQSNSRTTRLKETKKRLILTLDDIVSIDDAMAKLSAI